MTEIASPAPSSRWCVVQTNWKSEDIAFSNIQGAGFDVFYPLLREHRRKETKLVPMFPGYLFVAIEPDSRWCSMLSMRGVKRVITAEFGKPAILPRGWVESLRAKGVVDEFVDALSFRKGDTVEFIAGPFEGHTAVCKWTSERRIGVLFNCMGHESVLICEPNMLRPAREK